MDRGSKFLAFAFPVQNEADASKALQRIKKDHLKARHYCTAIRLHPDGSLERSNDDGEPSGSAGKPILGQLVRNQLTNVMVIVVRYFGGTKLGIPGLNEAYKTSTSNAIQNGKIIKRKVYGTVRIDLSYEQLPSFINHCKQTGVLILKEDYTDTPSVIIGFSRSSLEAELKTTLQKLTGMNFMSIEEYALYMYIQIKLLKTEIIL